MPVAPKRPCPGKGPRRGRCKNVVSKSERCCQDCEPYLKKEIRRYDSARDESPGRKYLHSNLWRRVRGMKLSEQPLCERHLAQGEVVPAVLVHHKDRNEFNTLKENLESLCSRCHEDEHKSERFGRSNATASNSDPT